MDSLDNYSILICCVRSIHSTAGMAAAHHPPCPSNFLNILSKHIKTIYNVITSSGYRLRALSKAWDPLQRSAKYLWYSMIVYDHNLSSASMSLLYFLWTQSLSDQSSCLAGRVATWSGMVMMLWHVIPRVLQRARQRLMLAARRGPRQLPARPRWEVRDSKPGVTTGHIHIVSYCVCIHACASTVF